VRRNAVDEPAVSGWEDLQENGGQGQDAEDREADVGSLADPGQLAVADDEASVDVRPVMSRRRVAGDAAVGDEGDFVLSPPRVLPSRRSVTIEGVSRRGAKPSKHPSSGALCGAMVPCR
jgi:hypothetical protein